MKEFVLENIGILFYLIGCLIVLILFATRRRAYKFKIMDIVILMLSWASIAAALFVLRDIYYKSIENK